MAATNDYYGILGVSKTATQDEIKKAFRKKAREHHPDAGGDEEQFKKINEAYEVLSDPEKREMYDQYGTADASHIPYNNAGGGGTYTYGGNVDWDDIFGSSSGSRRTGGFGGFSGFDDIFGDFGGFGAGSRRSAPRKEQDVTATLEVTFDEAFKGTTKTVTLNVPGRTEPVTLDVKVPEGARDGGKLRYKNKGIPNTQGGEDGDLLIETVIQEHPYYKRSKADVLMNLPIGFDEAALGGSVMIPAPDGSKVKVKIPKGAQDGQVLRVRGKGAKDVTAKDDRHGDLLLSLTIPVPTRLNKEQREALEAYGKASKIKRPWD